MASPTGTAPSSTAAAVAETADIDAVVNAAAAAAESWAAVPLLERAAMLDRLVARTDEVSGAWAQAGVRGKGLPEGSPLISEEWMGGPWALIAGATAYAETLRAIAGGGLPFPDSAVHERPDGQLLVDAYPTSLTERLLLQRFHAQVWIDPAVSRNELAGTVAQLYAGDGPADRGVCAVMGAGNIASITPLDVIYALFAEGFTVVTKLSPVNGYLQPQLEHIFGEFIDRDWVRIVQGDATIGEQLVTHPKVRAVHVTGSGATHDAIVFGSGQEAAERRAAGTSRLDKPVTAELGGVTPVIVVPGKWSARDLRFQADHIATQKLMNSGHNCIATQIVVMPADWDQAEAFTHHLEAALRRLAVRDEYYPGAESRHASMLAAAPGCEVIGRGDPALLVAELDATKDEPAFTIEAFGGFLGIVRLPGDTDAFLRAATEFANDRLAGTLGASVIVDPKTAKAHAAGLDGLIAGLRYGAVCVNAWAAVAFLLPRCSWGGYPGATLTDIQSGTGIVHNAYLLGRVQKSVVTAPFRQSPTPPWFVTNKTSAVSAERISHHAADPTVGKLLGVFASALRG
ncbi:MAG: aldehyde dehydrogenase [Solirubrobacteraceae bacterium]|nr:aldehyde dehydrogenase [Solirubrobacteraceae bacterium]